MTQAYDLNQNDKHFFADIYKTPFMPCPKCGRNGRAVWIDYDVRLTVAVVMCYGCGHRTAAFEIPDGASEFDRIRLRLLAKKAWNDQDRNGINADPGLDTENWGNLWSKMQDGLLLGMSRPEVYRLFERNLTGGSEKE